MSVFDLSLFVSSAATLGAYVCRLDVLTWRRHRASVIVWHIVGATGCAWVMTQAGQGASGAGCLVPLAAAITWLATSYHDWRNGPPPYAFKRGVTARS
jgi:hypothetical protein